MDICERVISFECLIGNHSIGTIEELTHCFGVPDLKSGEQKYLSAITQNETRPWKFLPWEDLERTEKRAFTETNSMRIYLEIAVTKSLHPMDNID